MSYDGNSFQISLYVKGDELSPDELTKAIGAAPTRSHFKGHAWSTSSGRQVTEKTGVWVLEMRGDDSESFPELVSRFGERLAGVCAGLETLPGVEVAYLDVLVLKKSDLDGGGTCEFDLDKKSVSILREFGLHVQFTVAIVVP